MRAARLPSQSYIAFPILLGQAMAFSRLGVIDWGLFLAAQLFGLCIQLFIVFANDWADVEGDRANRTFNAFSGGSRVLVDGDIALTTMSRAIWLMVAVNLGLGLVMSILLGRPLSLMFILGCLLLLWIYSYPPFRQSYRGGGEFLQMLGVAGVLPLFGYYLQSGTVEGFPLLVAFVLFPNQLGCAVSTSIPDYPADHQAQKHTAAVLFGPRYARWLVVFLNLVSIGLLWCHPLIPTMHARVMALVPLGITAWLLVLIRSADPGTKTLFQFVATNVFGVIALTVSLVAYLYFVGI